MCINKREIRNKYTGQKLYVSCGKCPACLQEKANASAYKIRNNQSSDLSCFFVTLNYDNNHIPVIFKHDIYNYKSSDVYNFDEERKELCLPVDLYRGIYPSFSNKIDTFDFPLNSLSTDVVSSLDNHCGVVVKTKNHKPVLFNEEIFSVCYTKDIQLFFKRLRQSLYRKFGFRPFVQYFQTSEYGPTTYRAHFHLCIFVKRSEVSFDAFRKACVKAWPFCSKEQMFRNVEIARSPSAYIASYVNCRADVPLFLNLKETKAKHTHSLYFGHNNELLSFNSIVNRFETQGTTLYPRELLSVDGVPQTSFLPLPRYINAYYFPKFKGMRFLSDAELFDSLRFPKSILSDTFRDKCQITYEESIIAKRNISRCFSHQDVFDNLNDWALFCIRFIQRSRSDSLRFTHYDVFNTEVDIRYCYDNILDYYKGDVESLYLDDVIFNYQDGFIVDPNDFPANIANHRRSLRTFDKRCKQRKINYLLSV